MYMSDKTKSYFFDFFQLFSDAFILLTGPIYTGSPLDIVFQILSLVIMLEASWEMKQTKFYRIPDVGKQSELVTSGIYRYIRNPMYLSQLLFCGILVANSFSPIRLFVWLLLLTNFLLKIQHEEALLHNNFPEFKEYKARSWKLIPYIY